MQPRFENAKQEFDWLIQESRRTHYDKMLPLVLDVVRQYLGSLQWEENGHYRVDVYDGIWHRVSIGTCFHTWVHITVRDNHLDFEEGRSEVAVKIPAGEDVDRWAPRLTELLALYCPRDFFDTLIKNSGINDVVEYFFVWHEWKEHAAILPDFTVPSVIIAMLKHYLFIRNNKERLQRVIDFVWQKCQNLLLDRGFVGRLPMELFKKLSDERFLELCSRFPAEVLKHGQYSDRFFNMQWGKNDALLHAMLADDGIAAELRRQTWWPEWWEEQQRIAAQKGDSGGLFMAQQKREGSGLSYEGIDKRPRNGSSGHG